MKRKLEPWPANIIRERLRRGELVIGGHAFLQDPAVTEALGWHGYDFVWIDGEHSIYGDSALNAHIMAAAAAGTASFVRLPWNDPVRIKPVLEMGPDGLILPMVCSAKEAESAVKACLYPPEGTRGFGPRRAAGYGAIPAGEYIRDARDSFMRLMQIEHVRAVEAIDEIAAVPGVDALIVGPYDLSGSIGKLGQIQDSAVLALCERVADACSGAGLPFGASLPAGDQAALTRWLSWGASVIACGDDLGFIAAGSRAVIDFLRGSQARPKG